MSVQKDRRKETPVSLPMMSVKHAKYVIQITRNPKVFDPQYNHEVTDDLVREAKGIHRAIWGANQVKVTSRERYSDRRKQQEEAVKLCRDLLSDIAIAKSIFHLRGRRVKSWTAVVTEIRNRTQAWIESEAYEYRKYR